MEEKSVTLKATAKESLISLLKVKSLITLMVAGALVYGFAAGLIGEEQFMQIGVMVFTFYFAKQSVD